MGPTPQFVQLFRWFIVVIIIGLSTPALGIKCFQCTQTATNKINKTERLCPSFDFSDHYVIECPYSTMCMKRTYEYELLKGQKVIATTRDCAQQQYKNQTFTNGAWTMQSSIDEPYKEGCKAGDTSLYCHCRGHLCNAATKADKMGYHTDAMAVIFVFNAMKYFRNTR